MSELLITRSAVNCDNLKRDYRFLHITDVRLCPADGTEAAARIEYNAPRINIFSRDGMRSDEYFTRFFEYARDNACDAVIMTGDITDTPTEPNIRALESAVKNSPVPAIRVVGNHDRSFFDDYRTKRAEALYLRRFAEVSGGNTELCAERFNGFNVPNSRGPHASRPLFSRGVYKQDSSDSDVPRRGENGQTHRA